MPDAAPALTGFHHFSPTVSDVEASAAWATWLDSLGVPHSGAVDATNPMPYSTLVFRDPDNIQLELIYFAS